MLTMPLTRIQTLTLLGFTTADYRNTIIADLMPDNLGELEELDVDDVKEACNDYNFNVLCIKVNRLQSLCLWVKDRKRACAVINIPDGTDAADLQKMLKASVEREDRRKAMKKTGEGLIDMSFNNKLKSQNQWQKFKQELWSTLSMIIGVKGIPLTYVIRENDNPAFNKDVPFDKSVILGTAINDEAFSQDAQVVHQIILHNVPENLDAYTYIKPVLKKRNGRIDMEKLQVRFETAATSQAIINQAKQTLSNL